MELCFRVSSALRLFPLPALSYSFSKVCSRHWLPTWHCCDTQELKYHWWYLFCTVVARLLLGWLGMERSHCRGMVSLPGVCMLWEGGAGSVGKAWPWKCCFPAGRTAVCSLSQGQPQCSSVSPFSDLPWTDCGRPADLLSSLVPRLTLGSAPGILVVPIWLRSHAELQ